MRFCGAAFVQTRFLYAVATGPPHMLVTSVRAVVPRGTDVLKTLVSYIPNLQIGVLETLP